MTQRDFFVLQNEIFFEILIVWHTFCKEFYVKSKRREKINILTSHHKRKDYIVLY